MIKMIDDMGVAAFLRMNGFKLVGRKSRTFYFEVATDDVSEFDKNSFDYINSVFHTFDANLMALKKMPNYLANDVDK